MAGLGLIFDGCGVNGDTSGLLLGGLVDGAILDVLCPLLFSQELGDGGGESCLSVVDMADSAD